MKDENKKAKKTKTPKEYTEEDLQNDLEKSGDFRKLYDMVFENGECIFRNEYTRKRFIQSVYWYHQSARKCKKMFYLLSIIAIVLPTAVTVLSAFTENFVVKLTVSILSALTAICTSLLTLFKVQQKWIQFRTTAETMHTELSLFLSCTGDYSYASLKKTFEEECDSSKPFNSEAIADLKEKIFLVRIERVMAEEKDQWINLNKATSTTAAASMVSMRSDNYVSREENEEQ